MCLILWLEILEVTRVMVNSQISVKNLLWSLFSLIWIYYFASLLKIKALWSLSLISFRLNSYLFKFIFFFYLNIKLYYTLQNRVSIYKRKNQLKTWNLKSYLINPILEHNFLLFRSFCQNWFWTNKSFFFFFFSLFKHRTNKSI